MGSQDGHPRAPDQHDEPRTVDLVEDIRLAASMTNRARILREVNGGSNSAANPVAGLNAEGA